ncbi:alpha/beta hydrolase [Massilia sp. MS-15]|uniref:alpha/beta hydrolase n=1 Tax=Massilia sp. MS-15 TaxID=2878200 RepID=UPI001CD1F965|nr:alpha/beta hydrolase [Massilia sp. MS-15]MCA1247266.1 alpha/beta hydrolase [Massilia sp. MS-15]
MSAVLERAPATAAAGSADVNVRELEVAGAQGALAARLYSAGTPVRRDTLVVFFHGGGFVSGDLQEADEFLRHLALCSQERAVLASNYTLATVSPFPAAVEDAHAVLLWTTKNKAKLGWSGKRLVVMGIEAGANLAAVCALMARDRAAPKLAGQILVMPMLDPGLSTCSMRQMNDCPDREKVTSSCAEAYRGYLPHAADRAHPYASPLRSTRLKNLPPCLILSTEDDPLCDEAEQYGAKLIGAGVPTTVRRMPPAPLVEPGGRNECACKVHALAEIASFLAGLER